MTGLNLNRVTVATLANVGFDAAQSMAVPDGATVLRPTSILVADLNRDGHGDVVTISARDHKISVLLGHGDGSFDAAINYDVGFNQGIFDLQKAGIVADLNGDGVPDIATADRYNVNVFIGNGDGTFAAPVQTPIISPSFGLTYVYDLSTINLADGVRLVVDGTQVYRQPGTDGTHLNDYGDYTSLNVFTIDTAGHLVRDNHLTSVPVAGGAYATLLDFDGDGRLDIGGGAYDNTFVSDYVSPGDSPREGPGRTSVTYGIDQVALNSLLPGMSSPWTDGKSLLYYAYDMRVLAKVTTAGLLGAGLEPYSSGTLSGVVAAGPNWLSVTIVSNDLHGFNCIYASSIVDPRSVRVVDVDDDGALDVVVAGFDGGSHGVLSVFYDEGNGHLYNERAMPLPDFGTRRSLDLNIDSIAIGDINDDGKPDVVSVVGFLNSISRGISILLNHSVPSVAMGDSAITPLLAQQASLTIGPDTRAPAAPSVPILGQGSDSGISDSDKLTNVSTPTVAGTAEAGSTVTLYDTDGVTELGHAVATGGVYTITASALGDGVHTLTTRAVDGVGHVGAVSGPLTITVDTVASSPTAPHLVQASDSGVSNSDRITNVSAPALIGTTEAGSTVILYDTGGTYELGRVTAVDGTYTITSPELDDGSHTLTVRVVDLAGNTSAASSPLVFATDTVGPDAPNAVLAHDTGRSGTDRITSNAALVVTAGENGGTLLYKLDDAADFSAVAPVLANDGSVDGDHTILVAQRDDAGNIGDTFSFNFTLDSAPKPTGINAAPGHGAVFAGSTVSFTLQFDDGVDVAGGTPSLTLNDGASAVYNPAATAALHDATRLVFDYLVSEHDPITPSLAVTGFSAHGATVLDLGGNTADLSHVAAAFSALSVNTSVVAPQTFGNFTRPELHLDVSGHIILDGPAAAFAATYGTKLLYIGMPADAPFPAIDLAHANFHLV